MTPRDAMLQNRIKLLTSFVFIGLIALALLFLRPDRSESSPTGGGNEAKMFMGLRHPKASEVQQALPESKGKPTLLVFHSRFCHDCKKMRPVLDALAPRHPKLVYRKFDILEDAKAYPAVFRAFKPVSVPVMIFIQPNGEIINVLYNYQTPETMTLAIEDLEKRAAGSGRNTVTKR